MEGGIRRELMGEGEVGIFIIHNVIYIIHPISLAWISFTCWHNPKISEGTECCTTCKHV